MLKSARKSIWRIRVNDTHEPIISRELFEEVQTLRERASEKSLVRPKSPYTPNIFKGKIFCGICGSPLHRQRATRVKNGDVYIFHCLSNSRKARGSCVPYSLPEKELTAMLICLIEKHASVVAGKALTLQSPCGVLDQKRASIQKELKALSRMTDKSAQMIGSLFENLSQGFITAKEYREMRSEYENTSEDNLARCADLTSQLKTLDKQSAEYSTLPALMADAQNDGLTVQIVNGLVDQIRVYPNRRIEVCFRFESGFDLIQEVGADE